MRRLSLALLAAGLLLTGCGGASAPAGPDQVRSVAVPPPVTLAPAVTRAAPSAAGVAAVEAPAFVPQRGPFRGTGRGTFSWRTAPVTAARLGSSHRAGARWRSPTCAWSR